MPISDSASSRLVASAVGSWSASLASVIASIQASIVETAGPSLLGLYLFGSLATGDFDEEVSDIDLIAVLTNDPSEQLAATLRDMHDALAQRHPPWAGRIEVIYVSAGRLSRFEEGIPRMAVISPGKPFHVTEGGRDWVLNWYPAREEAVALVGPRIDAFIPAIDPAIFHDAVQQHLRAIPDWIADGEPAGPQAYAILTMCRGLYTLRLRVRPSKMQAAKWAADVFPEWAELISSALAWRKSGDEDPGARRASVAETRRFIADMVLHIAP